MRKSCHLISAVIAGRHDPAPRSADARRRGGTVAIPPGRRTAHEGVGTYLVFDGDKAKGQPMCPQGGSAPRRQPARR